MIKRAGHKTNPFLNAGLQMFFGGLWCFVLSLFFDDLSDVHFASTTIFSIGYLSLVGSITAFMLYTYALTKLPITIASLYAYINPLVAVVLGWVVLDEKLNFKIGIAIVVTVIGIYLVNRGYQLKTQKALDASKL